MSALTSSILRVGIVPYLNMLPLIHGMEDLELEGRRLTVAGVPPSVMTRMMDDGKLDIGMLPVGALVDRPDWPIVGRSMIGSDGAVRSVLLAGWGDPSGWRRLHPDSQSRSSNLLARVLLRKFMGVREIEVAAPLPLDDDWTPPAAGSEDEAFVIIGTRALRWREHWTKHGGHALDMGAEWKRHTGLPFVFAVWVARPGLDLKAARVADWMEKFEGLKKENLARLPEIIATWPGLAQERQSPDEAHEYLTRFIRFNFDESARAGLEKFLAEAKAL